MNTGSQVFGRPSLGSWLTYGLGSDSQDLPGFVVLLSGENAPDGALESLRGAEERFQVLDQAVDKLRRDEAS
jgi:hypothetical protein